MESVATAVEYSGLPTAVTSTESEIRLRVELVPIRIPVPDYAGYLRNIVRAAIRTTYEFEGEEFVLERLDDEIVLHHPIWSLMGAGRTLLEAEGAMRQMARNVLPAYHPSARLSPEASRMCEFMLRIA